ncbi:hypothetical protein KZZ52_21875 [Dactylosporangium sp. AC04546]|uniref:hypothetical protein n=1 Tax=Dactylosporangium sp. AC04546 TaxID=2862460 RepID=UPI001EDFD9CC|nr:hypothetical protein [Dactylosporangium sp. AC04546]WVK87931.1 hypothetical protein KZZ52_21875 [Dactylosporangium sp. AC04546]
MAIHVDLQGTGEELRQRLYDGHLLVMTRLPSVAQLVEHARAQLTDLFAPHDPLHAHEHFSPDEMAKVLGAWKPRFIHDERSKKLVRNIIEELGFDATETHYDVPKPRTAFPVGHLTTGVAFAFPWHRDVWYSAPNQQLNWWLPVFPVRETNAMSFDLDRFNAPVPNNSGDFDYYANNVGRLSTAASVKKEAQVRPGAIDHNPPNEQVVLPAPGQVLLFSGAHLHRSIPNTSGLARYSIDFRTVHAPDVLAQKGAPLADTYCTGTAIRDFINVADESRFDEETVVRLYGAPPADAMLVFEAPKA